MWARAAAALTAAVFAADAQAPSSVAARAAAAVNCVTDTLTAGFPAGWRGTRVGQLTIRARNVEVPKGIAESAVQLVHQPTGLRVISGELAFVAGQETDSLAVLESVRRLRRSSLFSEVILEGTRCSGDTTDFTIWTRDAWSIRGDFRFGRVASRVTLADINVLGTARSLLVRGEEVDDRRSLTVAFADPYLFGGRAQGGIALRSYADGRAWYWTLGTRDFSPRDVWRASLLSSQVRRAGDDIATQTHTDIERRATAVSLSRRVILEPLAAWAVEVGVVGERADLMVLRPGPMLGNPEVHREFVAPLLGLQRRALGFSSIDWFVPGQAPAELPVGIDAEAVVAMGREERSGTRLTHVDGWMGVIGRPTPGTIVTGDMWWSGYWGQDSLSDGKLRIAAAFYARANGGMWILRGASERVYNPDPDVFALSTADPMLRTLTPESRLAESALSVTLERSLHVRESERRWVLDAAAFATYSERHRSVDQNLTETQDPRAVIVGIGIRRVRNQPTQAALRLDIARAVWRTSDLPNRWIVVLSTTPWIGAGRGRDGARDVR